VANITFGRAQIVSSNETFGPLIFNSIILQGGDVEQREVLIVGEQNGLTSSNFVSDSFIKEDNLIV